MERDIRPHALGKFSELLLATARHPAMLIYLDNAESSREAGTVPAGRRRRGGLNENYARELLELHTLGVDGGYTQADVQAVARVSTGWSVVRINEGGFDFVFRRNAHDRGEKIVLGRLFPRDQGEAEGLRLLELLARRPATAKHLLGACARASSPTNRPKAACWPRRRVHALRRRHSRSAARHRQRRELSGRRPRAAAKLKTPLELLASAARALGAKPDGSLALSQDDGGAR